MAVLSIHPKPSYWLATILSLVHCAAIGLTSSLPTLLDIKVMLVTMLIISMIYYLGKDALLISQDAIKVLILSEEMSCQLTMRSGESISCSILKDSFVAPYLTVVGLKPEGKFFPRSLVILKDSLDVEEFRQLRVWLRWKQNKTLKEQ